MNAEANAQQTRQKILEVAANEIHLHGFQACKISTIIEKSGVSKGALYHHFPSKMALGYAVVDELLAIKDIAIWQEALSSKQPIPAMIKLLHNMLNELSSDDISKGCPLNNLAQEMSPIDEGFRQRINQIISLWQQGIEEALRQSQKNKQVRLDINPKHTSIFVVACIEGGIGLAKNSQDINILNECVESLIHYLEALLTPQARGDSNE